METLFKFLLGFLFLIFSFFSSFTYVNSDNLSLLEAINQKLVQVTLKSNGNYSGNSILVSCKNKTSKKFNLIIPATSYFKANGEEYQDLITIKDVQFALNPNGTFNKTLDGFCCKAAKKCPKNESEFKLVEHSIQNMDKLAKLLKDKELESHVIQDAIWSISDKRPLTNIYSSQNQDFIKKLRNELSLITGQKNEWFDSPQNRTVDPYGNINFETVKVEGNINLFIPNNGTLYQEVQDSTGKKMLTSGKKFTVTKGNTKYYFKVEVSGWNKGTYSVKIYNNSKVIQENKFKV